MNKPKARENGIAPFDTYFERNIEAATALRPFRVLIAGIGTTGSMVAAILAKAGLGTLVLFDPDAVEPGNLHRQQMSARYIGMNKAGAMAATIRAEVSTDQSIVGMFHDLEEIPLDVLRGVVSMVHLVIAATGNDVADVRLNRACRDERVPLIAPSLYPGTWREQVGCVQVINWPDRERRGACFECLHGRTSRRRTDQREPLSGQAGEPMDVWSVGTFTVQVVTALLRPTSPRGQWLSRELSAGFTEFQVGRLVPQISPTRTTPSPGCEACGGEWRSAATTAPRPTARSERLARRQVRVMPRLGPAEKVITWLTHGELKWRDL